MVRHLLLAVALSIASGLPADAHAQQIRDTGFILREIHTPEPGHILYHAVFIDARNPIADLDGAVTCIRLNAYATSSRSGGM